MMTDTRHVHVLFLGMACGAVLSFCCFTMFFPSQPLRLVPLLNLKPSRHTTNHEAQRVNDNHPETTSSQGSNSPTHKDTSNDTFLIYSCDGRHGLCGGWADRQKGIVGAFLLAYVTKRRFGIWMPFPCDVRQFYEPNDYDWVVRDDEIRNRTQRLFKTIDRGSPFLKELQSMDFNARYPEDVVVVQSNNELYKPLSLNPLYNGSFPLWAQRPVSPIRFFHDVWHMLMKPSARLQRRLSSLLTQLNYFRRERPLVGVHVRIGNSATIKDSAVKNTITKLGPLWDLLTDYVGNGSRLFLATDNLDVRQISRDKYGSAHYDSGGLIMHVDRKNKATEACPGFEDALVEQLMLARCDVIIMSVSGFSLRAVMMRGSSRNTVVFNNGRISPFDKVYKSKLSF